MAEAFALLRQALNIYSSSEHAVSINRAHYLANRFVYGFPTSVIPGQPFSSVSTRSGDLLSVLIKNMAAGVASRAHIHLVAEVILEIGSGGVTFLE